MIGMMYYSLFLVMGLLYSDTIFKEKSLWFKIWSGGVIGNVILMCGIIPFAMIFGFSIAAHVVLAVITVVVYLLLRKTPELHFTMPHFLPAAAAGAIALLICVLFANHVIMPVENGMAVGQSTYGDLAMHLGFITSVAEQGSFPPMYNLLWGERLCYPFLADSLSSSLYLFGTDIRTAVLYPSFVFGALTVLGLYFLAVRLTKSRKGAVLAAVLFFLGGGFGFAYFLDGAKAEPDIFTRIFTGYYQTPTNFNGQNIRWANPICDMIIPQRTTMAGWCALFFALWLLVDALEEKSRRRFLMLGITAGAMPMIHTHSFLALGVISAAVFFVSLAEEKNKKEYVVSWIIYGGVAAVLAVPQLIVWTFAQSVGNGQFLRLGFNWVNRSDPYIWFWLKNWGITAVFAVPALIAAKGTQKKLLSGAILLFIVSELVIFQPNEYDNNKLFFVVYTLFVITVSDYLTMLYERLKEIPGMGIIAVMIIFFGVFSGVLTIAREYKSGGDYVVFSEQDKEFSEFIRENTSPDSVFACSNQHWNPVSVLAGRNLYAGSELYVYFHGYRDEMYKRYGELERLYESRTTAELSENLKAMPEIDYILISREEKNAYDITADAFSEQEKIYDKDGFLLYKKNIE